MADGYKIEVTGLRELAAAARRVRDTGLSAAMRLANKKIADAVAEKAQGYAPVGSAPDPHPGRLRAGIKGRATPSSASVAVGSKALPYAPPIHWGWARHNIAANPFLKRAADEAEADVEGWYGEVADKVSQEVSTDG